MGRRSTLALAVGGLAVLTVLATRHGLSGLFEGAPCGGQDCAPDASDSEDGEAELGGDKTCATDSDCVIVPISCCGAAAFNAASAPAYRFTPNANQCARYRCAQPAAAAQCVNFRCREQWLEAG